MLIKLLITLFVLFALSRAYLRYRDASLSTGSFAFWVFVWLCVEAFIWWPKVSDVVAKKIGIGRGVDAVVYIAVIALFYAVFRLYVKMEFIEHEITSLVRQLALRNAQENSDSSAEHQVDENNHEE